MLPGHLNPLDRAGNLDCNRCKYLAQKLRYSRELIPLYCDDHAPPCLMGSAVINPREQALANWMLFNRYSSLNAVLTALLPSLSCKEDFMNVELRSYRLIQHGEVTKIQFLHSQKLRTYIEARVDSDRKNGSNATRGPEVSFHTTLPQPLPKDNLVLSQTPYSNPLSVPVSVNLTHAQGAVSEDATANSAVTHNTATAALGGKRPNQNTASPGLSDGEMKRLLNICHELAINTRIDIHQNTTNSKSIKVCNLEIEGVTLCLKTNDAAQLYNISNTHKSWRPSPAYMLCASQIHRAITTNRLETSSLQSQRHGV